MGIYDVPANRLIEVVAGELKGKVQQPEFTAFVKTGAHKERAPLNPDWYFMRSASILYRVYREGETGTESLRTYYGGRKNRGVKPEKRVKASGKIIRSCLQNLEKSGLVKKGKKGRVITGAGEKLLYEKAKVVEKEFAEEVKKKAEKEAEAKQKREARKAQAKKKEEQPKQEEKTPHKGGEKRTEQKPQGKGAPEKKEVKEDGRGGKAEKA